MRLITSVISFSLMLLASASPSPPSRVVTTVAARCAKNLCGGVNSKVVSSSQYICGDNRLGPVDLQNNKIRQNAVVGPILRNYNPFPGTCPDEFLRAYGQGAGYKYPAQDGFDVDSHGKPVKKKMILAPRTILDRFGSDRGTFVAPYGTPYEQRSLPPENLATDPRFSDGTPYNFHIYEVVKDLPVQAGPAAPWFGQVGHGTQYMLSMKVREAIRDGYLVETCTPGMHACGMNPNTNVPTQIICNKSRRWEITGSGPIDKQIDPR
ncbi:uncharacterized protein MAM_03475 [Metarhizium album ARSEF 1941]|uniref:TNT domain-containing protein n=1 Tax=Metarhizium album (strain ARSEF 1941) TaxID=1081103 RepID=A0A0B2WQL4_METAS|nr:uncharacterized protein MAM_03475 [Metarhizium album ARSEF 1941]KHN98351.1 hypothetical protein MAM_03475 [Metarhizium album ARSEF 1941]